MSEITEIFNIWQQQDIERIKNIMKHKIKYFQ
jgi:hypothetical protein